MSNTEWHNIVLWRGLAEVAINWLKKGDSVYIEGKLKTRSWEDENGIKKYATDIQADNLSMLGSRRETDNFSQSQSSNQNTIDEKRESSEKIHDSSNEEDDLPF